MTDLMNLGLITQTFDDQYATFAANDASSRAIRMCFALATSSVFINTFMPIYLHFMQSVIKALANPK